MSRASRRMPALLALLAGAAAGALAAHDLWLVPARYFAEPNRDLEIEAVTGMQFPISVAALDPARLASAEVLGPEGRSEIRIMGRRGDALVLVTRPRSRGQHWVAIATRPRRIDLSAEQFNEYLREDGLPQVYELRASRGELDRPATERYSKHAKALIQVGRGGSARWDERLGHVIEVVPLADPLARRPGDTLAVRVLLYGRPIGGLTVTAGGAGGTAGAGGAAPSVTAVTDSAGVASFALPSPGIWFVKTIHMAEIREPPFQWESVWATLTFEVR